MEEISGKYKTRLLKLISVFLIIISVYFIVQIFSHSERDENGNQIVNTISFSGHGEVQAVPNIANIDFTIRKDAKTVKGAQDAVAQVEKSSLDLLKTDGVDLKDIKTQSVSLNPKYEYQYYKDVTCGALTCPPRPSTQVLTGYEAYENITVKIRKTDDVGKIIQGLGTIGVTELNGPNFTIDNEDTLKAVARKSAIDDAKAKAKSLAKDLGVRLVKITSFSEGGNYPVPMYAKAMAVDSVAGAAPAVIPTGENTISSDVTITYEIK